MDIIGLHVMKSNDNDMQEHINSIFKHIEKECDRIYGTLDCLSGTHVTKGALLEMVQIYFVAKAMRNVYGNFPTNEQKLNMFKDLFTKVNRLINLENVQAQNQKLKGEI